MAAPIIFVSTFRIHEARADEFARAYESAVETIAMAKPRTAVFAAYADRGRQEARIVHVFPDGAAMESHFEGSDARAATISRLASITGFEVLGTAPVALLDQLRREGLGIEPAVLADSLGGFLRTPP